MAELLGAEYALIAEGMSGRTTNLDSPERSGTGIIPRQFRQHTAGERQLRSKVLLRYLPWEDQGMVLAKNVFARKDIEGTAYPLAAKALGERV